MWFGFVLSYVYGHFVCMQVCVPLVCPGSPEEGIRCVGTGVTDGFELPCGCWELKPGAHIEVRWKNN